LALADINFNIYEGQFVCIIGPSGCGKTTILSLAAGLLKPSGGTIERGNATFGYMLQKDALFPWRTVKQNIFLPLEVKGCNTRKKRDEALALAYKYGLGDFLNSKPNSLSGGMRQRVALIRTLVANPNILLLDEPFSALDYQTRLSVCDDVHAIIKGEGKTALLVTHDISEAIALSDKVIVLSFRPAKVIAEHAITFGDGDPKLKRTDTQFAKTFELLRAQLGL
jgi:NitT/TauT family transport system ATP-binding protein